jgi:outer membrane protein OmpA-like peptidoglycan-associated protein
VLFDFDKYDVKDTGQAEIAKVAGILKDNPGDTVTIEGHTCDINRSGDPDYNTKLGQRRADAVQAVLIENGIDADRVNAASFGESRPAVPNTSDENRQLNRRVVFVYSISD